MCPAALQPGLHLICLHIVDIGDEENTWSVSSLSSVKQNKTNKTNKTAPALKNSI